VRLLFAGPGAPGHVNPTLPLVRELADRGHDITYLTDGSFRRTVETAGARFAALPPLDIPSAGSGDPAAVMGTMMRALVGYQAGLLRDGVVDRQLRECGADAVCYDGMLAAPVTRAAAGARIPAIALHPTYAPPGGPADPARPGGPTGPAGPTGPGAGPGTGDGVGPRLDADADDPGIAALFRSMVEHGRAAAGELGETGLDPFGGPVAELNIVFVPREFQPGGDAFDERYRFVGPSVGHRAGDDGWTAPSERPAVLVSLGTSPFNEDVAFLRAAIEAFADGRWQVLLAVGDRVALDDLGAIPPNVHVERYLPQLLALRRVDVFVSHTGMNSTMESLNEGVPLVAVPLQAEQEANADRVEQLGLGRRLRGDRTPEAIRAAVEQVHADAAIRAAVGAMGEALRRAGGARAAADAIEAHVAAPG